MTPARRFFAACIAIATVGPSTVFAADNAVITDNAARAAAVTRTDPGPGPKDNVYAPVKTDWNISRYPPCEEDIQRLCQDGERGGGRIFNCLSGNIDAIKSYKCKTRASDLSFALKVILHECRDDIEFFCESDDTVSVLKCIDRNRDSVSEKCLDEFDDDRRAKAVERFVKQRAAGEGPAGEQALEKR